MKISILIALSAGQTYAAPPPTVSRRLAGGGGGGGHGPQTSYGSCETAKDGHHEGDGHAHRRRLASGGGGASDSSVQCNVKEADCDGHWEGPGYVSNTTGCCLCGGSCDHAKEFTVDDKHDDGHRRLASAAPEDQCTYYDAPSGGGHGFKFSYSSCHHACHDCERRGCQRYWLQADDAGRQGPGRSGRIESTYYEGLIVLALLCITLMFEIGHHHLIHWAGELHSTSGWMAHVTGAHDAPPHEHHHAHHPRDFVTCFTWNEWHPHWARQLLDQTKWEITVLGFLALIVFACHSLKVFDAIALGSDGRWGAQSHNQVFIAVEHAHFALFLGICMYFICLGVVLFFTDRMMKNQVQYERVLALRRARAREAAGKDVEEDGEKHTQSVAVLEKVVAQGGKEGGKRFESFKNIRMGVIDFLRHRGIPTHLPHLRLDDGPGSFDDEFHFAIYLRAHFEAFVVEMIHISVTTWLLFMALLAFFFVGLARSRALGLYTTFLPGLVAGAFEIVCFCYTTYRVKRFERKAVRRHAAVEAALAEGRGETDDELDDAHAPEIYQGKRVRAKFSGDKESFIIHLFQAFLLLDMFFVGSVIVQEDSYGCPDTQDCHGWLRVYDWTVVVLSILVFVTLGPATLYNCNIMLRVPPFIDDDDYDVIKQIVVMTTLRFYDEDGNGHLDADEIRPIIRKLDSSLDDAAIDALVRAADEDGDGRIDYHEFCKIMLNAAPEGIELAPKSDYVDNRTVATLPKQESRTKEGSDVTDSVTSPK